MTKKKPKECLVCWSYSVISRRRRTRCPECLAKQHDVEVYDRPKGRQPGTVESAAEAAEDG